MINGKKGQVWVETVIYTLIGLVLIGTVLAFATPFINEQKDRILIERSADSMNALDNAILNSKSQGIGNKREFSFLIGAGKLIVDPVSNKLSFDIEDSRHMYSEPGFTIDVSGTNLKVRTGKSGRDFDVSLTLDYNNKIDITYDYILNSDEGTSSQVLESAPNPYRLIIENLGKVPEDVVGGCVSGTVCTLNGNEPGTCNVAGDKCVPDRVKINIYDTS